MGARKFATFEDEAIHRGRQEGLAEGRAEGQAEGQAAGLRNALKIMIELRFGPLSDALSLRIGQIPAGDIDEWIARAMKADSLAALFDRGAPAGGAPLPP